MAKASTKLITIVEIVQRDCHVRGIPLFQYTALSSRLVDVSVPVNVPVLTVYLSTVPVKELRNAYG
jgi:hypothetical protein